MTRIRYLVLLLVFAAGCADTTAPGDDRRDESDLTFARLQAGAQLETSQRSFWAVRGQTRTLTIHYADSERIALEFVVGASALLTRPNGTPFLPGDSVLITVSATDQNRFVFDFQPAGLVFSPLQPALLRLDYTHAAADLNADGVIDQLDAALEARLGIWQQELPGLPWLPVPSIRLSGTSVIEGRVHHFTGFALASD